MSFQSTLTGAAIFRHPQTFARLCGLLYLMVIGLGGFAEGVVMNQMIVPGDMAATARHILAPQSLWMAGVIANLLVPVIAVVQLWIEYLLLRPVSRDGVLLAALFNLVSLAVEAVSKLFLIMVVPVLSEGDAHGLAQPQALAQALAVARLLLHGHDIAFNIALIFFGCTCLVNGYLIIRSGYLPKFVGLLLQLAGASYLIACFAALFAPALSTMISPAILLPALVGESSLCLWLLTMGVDLRRWRQCHRAPPP